MFSCLFSKLRQLDLRYLVIWQISYPNLMITKNAELVSMSIRNLKRLGDLKYQIQLFEMFNYLIWCDSKMMNWNGSSFWINWLSFFNLVIWIHFVKKNWTEKSRINIKKTQILNHSLIQNEVELTERGQTWSRSVDAGSWSWLSRL